MTAQVRIRAIHKNGMIGALRKAWGIKAGEQPHRNRLDIPASRGKGWIKAYRFEAGLYATLFKGRLHAPLDVVVETEEKTPILFAYQIKGDMQIGLFKRETFESVHELDVAIHAPYGSPEVNLVWPGEVQQQWVLVAIERKRYQAHLESTSQALPRRLGQLFRGGEERNSFYYQKPYGVHISRVLAQMLANRFKPGLEDAFIEAKTLELLTLQFFQYLDKTAPDKRKVDLKPMDLDAILLARQKIDGALEDPPTIPELARQVGVNVNKLKRGFKQVFNTTINRYTTGKRLDWANQMLLQDDMPVGEVVYRVGYENRSYFARIFKQRFGMHPSEVRQQLRTTLPAAEAQVTRS